MSADLSLDQELISYRHSSCCLSSSSSFGPVTGKAQLLTVDRLIGGTRRRLVPVERSDRLPSGTSGPRYGGAHSVHKLYYHFAGMIKRQGHQTLQSSQTKCTCYTDE